MELRGPTSLHTRLSREKLDKGPLRGSMEPYKTLSQVIAG